MQRILLLLLLALTCTGRADAQGTDAARVLTLINQARVSAGLSPLAAIPQLTTAAQAHADDMARNGVGIGHGGSDGSTPGTRILRAGYRPYSWGPFIGENWGAYRTIEESMNAWMSDLPHRGNILRPGYREIGVGVARSPSGAPILVTDFGAQPNVLPVFLNGTGTSVVLTLNNEDAAPGGDGSDVIGHVVTVELSSDASFSHAQAMPFASSIQYSSPDGKPISTVYVRFRDALGRTTVSSASTSGIVIAPAAAASKTATTAPTRKPAPTRQSTATRTLTRTSTPQPPTTAKTLAPESTDLPRGETKLAEAPTATATAREKVIVRRPVTTPVYIGSVSAAAAEQPIVTPFAIALFAGAGLLLLLSAATAWRRRRR